MGYTHIWNLSMCHAVLCNAIQWRHESKKMIKELNHPLPLEKAFLKKAKLYLIQVTFKISVRRDVLFLILLDRIFTCYKKDLFQVYPYFNAQQPFILVAAFHSLVETKHVFIIQKGLRFSRCYKKLAKRCYSFTLFSWYTTSQNMWSQLWAMLCFSPLNVTFQRYMPSLEKISFTE